MSHDIMLVMETIRTAATFVASAILVALGIARWRNLRGYTRLFYSLAAVTCLSGLRGLTTLDLLSDALLTAIVTAQMLANVIFGLSLTLSYRELRHWQSPAQLLEHNRRLVLLLEHAEFRSGLSLDPVMLAEIRADIRAAREEIERYGRDVVADAG